MVHLSVIRIFKVALPVRIRDSGLVGLTGRFQALLDSLAGLHVADVTEAPVARDVDGAAPLVTSSGGPLGGNSCGYFEA
jgi:hypothetical protein